MNVGNPVLHPGLDRIGVRGNPLLGGRISLHLVGVDQRGNFVLLIGRHLELLQERKRHGVLRLQLGGRGLVEHVDRVITCVLTIFGCC